MRTPTSTYRLQLSADFTLFDAADRLGYISELGVDWVYLSPILQAGADSTHGYDVVSHDTVDAARGGAEGLAALSAAAKRLGMGVLVDIVPNHMGVAVPRENAAFWDLLTHGQQSAYARWFDIDWAAGNGRIRIPVTGDDDLGEDGAIANLSVVDGELRYHDNRFPIAPGTGDGEANAVHARQSYELVGWRRADHELNYRRFFGINTLAAVRVEDDEVFDATHREILRWISDGLVDGLRIDHPDGLRDPAGYLARLREATGGAFVVVEKILEPGEKLEKWACEGTTGYDSLGMIDRVLTDPSGEKALTAVDTRLRGHELDWHDLIHDTKRAVADELLGSETHRIVREIVDHTGDPASDELDDAVAELLACFPVYRSYLPAGIGHLQQAVREAKERRPELASVIDRVAELLADPASAPAQRFQQTSGMVMAKGVEDTAFYRYTRLTSLNEVGGDPSIFAMTVDEFHDAMRERQAEWPAAMNALSTHDTKRGEDVRARITTLAEDTDKWEALVDSLDEHFPRRDRPFGNLVMQAVFGAWPADDARLSEYAVKAAREAATVTQWTATDDEYETRLAGLVTAEIVSAQTGELTAETEQAWRSNVLSAKLLNMTIPGFPDIYQGTELIDDSLVDPDNRRPVAWDHAHRVHASASLEQADDLAVAKTLVVRETLRARRDRPDAFTTYEPLTATGQSAEHLIAFNRGQAIALATRLPLALASSGWAGTTIVLPEGRWRELFTGIAYQAGETSVGALLAELPVALLMKEDDHA